MTTPARSTLILPVLPGSRALVPSISLPPASHCSQPARKRLRGVLTLLAATPASPVMYRSLMENARSRWGKVGGLGPGADSGHWLLLGADGGGHVLAGRLLGSPGGLVRLVVGQVFLVGARQRHV